jgi:hypothetical protein
MKLDLNVRDLQQDLEGTQTFESVEAAKAWLEDRPKFIQVLGIASRHISKEVGEELRACRRDLDEDERQLKEQLATNAEEAARQHAKATREAEAEQHRVDMASADPNRPMDVSYRHDAEMSLTDVADTREITSEARQAVLAWVNERNTWVKSRGQIVGAANVRVWPGPMPEGKDERVVRGDFVPVANSD